MYKMYAMAVGEGQEKYVWELSVTPMGYFTGAIENRSCGVSHGDYHDYFAWRKCGMSEKQVTFTLDGIIERHGGIIRALVRSRLFPNLHCHGKVLYIMHDRIFEKCGDY
jgi:hypothetical protein